MLQDSALFNRTRNMYCLLKNPMNACLLIAVEQFLQVSMFQSSLCRLMLSFPPFDSTDRLGWSQPVEAARGSPAFHVLPCLLNFLYRFAISRIVGMLVTFGVTGASLRRSYDDVPQSCYEDFIHHFNIIPGLAHVDGCICILAYLSYSIHQCCPMLLRELG